MAFYQDKKQEKKKASFYDEEKEGNECPACHTLNELSAIFCEECAHKFHNENRCPKCNAKIRNNADICEACGEWLLEGHCKFCYADLEEGASYCAECGNPVVGKICPKCGKLSYFDFCKNCNIPLTETAKKMIEAMKTNPQEQELLNLFHNLDKLSVSLPQTCLEDKVEDKKSSQQQDLLKLKSYIEKVDKQKQNKVVTPLFSAKQQASINEMDKVVSVELKQQEEEKRRKEEEQRKLEEELKRQEEERRKLQELLEEMKSKTFSTNQEARLYFMSHKPRHTKGWRCNAYNNIHRNPCECAEPERGGVWLT